MSPYDPQRSRHRPSPADSEPAPVDALLEPHPVEPTLPDGVAIDVDGAGVATVHTESADVDVNAAGEDIVVRTVDAQIEVRAEADDVVITTGDEAIYVDTSPRDPDDQSGFDAGDRIGTESASAGRSRRWPWWRCSSPSSSSCWSGTAGGVDGESTDRARLIEHD